MRLAALAKVDLALLTNMKLMRETQGRKIYEWKGPGKAQIFMVVVSRPYWLSFYSHRFEASRLDGNCGLRIFV